VYCADCHQRLSVIAQRQAKVKLGVIMDRMSKKLVRSRADKGETVGGGFIIFRRGRTSGRIKLPAIKMPFEHKSFADAKLEMNRLAGLHKGNEFCVFYQVTSLKNG
jgi:hypothetical protein